MLFQPKDVEGLGQWILYALNHPDEIKERGQNLYTYVNDHFGQEAMAKSHGEIYKNILQRSKYD